MPTVEFSLKDLQSLLGKKIGLQQLEEEGILYAKGEIESKESVGDDFFLKADIKDTNRPDLWSIEGIARQLRGHYCAEEGMPRFAVKKSGIAMNVDKKVERVRAKTVAAVVKNLRFDDSSIKQIMQLQEKMHATFGRNREQVSIGIYDYGRLKPPIKYTTVKPDGIKFVPLDFDREMTPAEILVEHPKGREYGHIIKRFAEYPLVIDSAGNVLSMPPIINSAYTGKITPETRNIFIEITGHRIDRISVALSVLAAALHDRNGSIESVDINYPDKKIVMPDMSPRQLSFNPEYCRRILGIAMSGTEMLRLLRQARYDATAAGKRIAVKYPAYRSDIMHQRDVIEDIAISFGYNIIEPSAPKLATTGSSNALEDFSDAARQLMAGTGCQEIMTFTLTCKESIFDRMLTAGSAAEISNPVSANFSVLRTWLLPGMLGFLADNLHREYPQCIFEVGDCVVPDNRAETRAVNARKLACAITDNKAGYEDISSLLDAFLAGIGLKYKLKAAQHASFIAGRCAAVFAGGECAGIIGEIHPQVLNNFGLEKPAAGFELELGKIFDFILQ